jgi:Protein of unknown function (DUF1553)/Protein of unknown function (DUF1549)/Planctomycete cytochrome C
MAVRLFRRKSWVRWGSQRTNRLSTIGLALAGTILALNWTSYPVSADDGKKGLTVGESISPEAAEFFEARVRPIIADQCVKCHGPKKQSSGLRLDSRAAALKGGDSGPAVVPFKPDESLLLQAVEHTRDELKMPPERKLADSSIAMLRQWISMGAPWSADSMEKKTGAAASNAATSSRHWAFQPVKPQVPPPVKERDQVRTPVDSFVVAGLEAAGLTLSLPADRRTLIRRATLDLWGIPPTAEEVEAFAADTSADAFERLVDRLLASPRYGERWGRHWLDVARYADTKGYVFSQDRRYPYAYTYRDYVIAALNSDMPYDQFIIQQIAADQLPRGENVRPLAAMGFLTVGRRFLLDQNEIIDDRIDVVTRGLLGLTVTCARCHDHKYDPIPTEDYYSLYGVFASSTEPAELPLLTRPGNASHFADYDRKLKAASKALDDYLATRREELAADLKARFSWYFKAAHDLGFDADNQNLDERALADKLNSRRLKAVIALWNRRPESARKPDDPVFGPWNAFEAIPKEQFTAKAGDVYRKMKASCAANAETMHPLVAETVLTGPPASMNEVLERYATLFGELEARWEENATRNGTADDLPDAEWESLRHALFGTSSPLFVSTDLMREFLDQTQNEELNQLGGAIEDLNATHPGAPSRAMVLYDAAQPVEPRVFIRGNPGRPGPAVPRRFLRLLGESDRQPFQKGSGRLEMARAIADSKNPLTARVLVNRTWLWHFGKGLVATPSDFGLRSEPPSHPELLDYLASEFIASGWSQKSLHRLIMLSSTYRQRSDPREACVNRDPENRLLWRFNRQRLDFESMRDSILAVSGALDPAIGGPATLLTEAPFSTRRTLYGFIDRQNLDGLYRTFDFAVPDATSPRRFVTIVPQQALFLMNSPFLHEQARRLASSAGLDSRSVSTAGPAVSASDQAEGVRRLYRRVLGRTPETDELLLAIEFIGRQTDSPTNDTHAWKPAQNEKSDHPLAPWEQLSQVLLLTNEFMYVD